MPCLGSRMSNHKFCRPHCRLGHVVSELLQLPREAESEGSESARGLNKVLQVSAPCRCCCSGREDGTGSAGPGAAAVNVLHSFPCPEGAGAGLGSGSAREGRGGARTELPSLAPFPPRSFGLVERFEFRFHCRGRRLCAILVGGRVLLRGRWGEANRLFVTNKPQATRIGTCACPVQPPPPNRLGCINNVLFLLPSTVHIQVCPGIHDFSYPQIP